MGSPMSDPYQRYVDALTPGVSAERLLRYRRPADTDALDALARYAWNMALAEALYPALQCIEIALRNSLHTAVAAAGGQPQWLTTTPSALVNREAIKVAEAVQALARQTKPITAGRLIAELNFGFWTSLLDRRYEPALWPALLKASFPHMPRRRRTRQELSKRFIEIRHLRNRVFHHEPIWHWRDLPQQHVNLSEALAWINPALATAVGAIDRFSTIYGSGAAPLRAQLEPVARTP